MACTIYLHAKAMNHSMETNRKKMERVACGILYMYTGKKCEVETVT